LGPIPNPQSPIPKTKVKNILEENKILIKIIFFKIFINQMK
jgi:hypothetical protein